MESSQIMSPVTFACEDLVIDVVVWCSSIVNIKRKREIIKFRPCPQC